MQFLSSCNSFVMLQKLAMQASQCGQRLRWSALEAKINAMVSDKVNYRGAQS